MALNMADTLSPEGTVGFIEDLSLSLNLSKGTNSRVRHSEPVEKQLVDTRGIEVRINDDSVEGTEVRSGET